MRYRNVIIPSRYAEILHMGEKKVFYRWTQDGIAGEDCVCIATFYSRYRPATTFADLAIGDFFEERDRDSVDRYVKVNDNYLPGRGVAYHLADHKHSHFNLDDEVTKLNVTFEVA